MRELILFLVMCVYCLRILGIESLVQKICEGVPLVLSDDDEAPGRQLAVVRNPHRDLEDLPQLIVGRAGPNHFARATGTAGLEQG